jgi:glycerol-3-phosphate acyltransferase PlsY
MEFLLSTSIGYILGSFPTAFLMVKIFRGIDITKTGSGNVGALNTIRISKSKLIGFSVLLIDAFKGALSIFISFLLFPDTFIFAALALLFAVFAHCFNPWLGFNGGRGLAVVAGGGLIIFPYTVLMWVLLWVIFFLMKKNHHIANIAATIFTLLLLFNTVDIAMKYSIIKPESSSSLIVITAALLMIIFIKHIEPLKEIIEKYKTNRVIKND